MFAAFIHNQRILIHVHVYLYVVDVSLDFSWRLWDVETAAELQLQDGHSKECSSICFQKDGALAASTDWGGVVLTWDLRSGKQFYLSIYLYVHIIVDEFL